MFVVMRFSARSMTVIHRELKSFVDAIRGAEVHCRSFSIFLYALQKTGKTTPLVDCMQGMVYFLA